MSIVAIMKLSELQKKIVKFADDKLGACGGISISHNQPGIEFSNKDLLKKFLDFIVWDYNTHIVFDAFLRGKITEAKHERITHSVSEMVKVCHPLK